MNPQGRSVSVGVLRTTAAFAALAAGLLVLAAGRIRVIDLGFTLSRLQVEQQALVRENARLRIEVLTLRSPARLERLARERLRMAPPASSEVLRELRSRRPSAPTVRSALLAVRP